MANIQIADYEQMANNAKRIHSEGEAMNSNFLSVYEQVKE